MYSIRKTDNGRGGVWVQGSHDVDIMKSKGKLGGLPGNLAGDDTIVGLRGGDVMYDRGGADHLFGGRGSDKFVERVGGNLILGDETHPSFIGATKGWAKRGSGADVDTLSYVKNADGIYVLGMSEWSPLGKELAVEYGLDTAKSFDPAEGQTSAYVIQNYVSGRVDKDDLRKMNVEDVLDDGIDIAVGIEELIGTEARDVFILSAHDDIVQGRGGRDYIYANAGDDVITGGSGKDRIVTGAGRDKVIFNAARDGDDIVYDFDVRTSRYDTNYDTLEIALGGKTYTLSTAQQFADFIVFLEKDGVGGTNARMHWDDLILDVGRTSIWLDDAILEISAAQDFRGQRGLVDDTLIDGVAYNWLDVIETI